MKVAQNLDAFTIDEIAGERVILTLPNVAGEPNTEYAGSAVFGKNYILDLCRYALQADIVNGDDFLALSNSTSGL